jgi:glycosyltransferase involved in cell wall biosynthesis
MNQLSRTPGAERPPTPTITAVVGAYNAEAWIGATLEAILSQTHAPDEVVVVDDGSTDGTAAELAKFGDAIRVVSQPNGGCPAAFNRAFREASGEYVAMCGADDLWEPDKLERQVSVLRAHPEIDVAFGGADIFGHIEGPFGPAPGDGLLDNARFTETLYAANIVCASSVLVRRELATRLGPFVERFSADDYDYWMRALRVGAVFFYDPHVLVRYRRHNANVTNNVLWMQQSTHLVHRWHADLPGDRRLVRTVLARDLFNIARLLVDEDRPGEARATFVASLRQRLAPLALAWALVLCVPERVRRQAVPALVALKRALRAQPAPVPHPTASAGD